MAQLKGNIAGCRDSARHDKRLVRLGTNCEALRRFLLAHRDHNSGDRNRSVISFRRQRARIHDAASKPCDAQFHALRQLIRRLAVACGSRISSPRLRMAPGQPRVDADFPRHAVSHAAGGCGRNRDQRRRSTRAPVGAHRHTLGWAALQLEIRIPVVSIRTCWRVDRVLWRFTNRASARRPCVPPNPDSDRVLTDVHRRALSVRRRLRSSSWNVLRTYRGALPITANRKSAIEIRDLRCR